MENQEEKEEIGASQPVSEENQAENQAEAEIGDHEKNALDLINQLCDNDDQRARERYGKGPLGRINSFFHREGQRLKAETLEETGKFKEFSKGRKWAKIGAKTLGGFGVGAALSLTGVGALPILTPILWTVAVRKGWDGLLEAGENLHWGKNRRKFELEKQALLSEDIESFKMAILERKAAGEVIPDELYAELAAKILDREKEVIESQELNIKGERRWKLGRAIASSVLTIGTGLIAGVPLGTRDYDGGEYAYRLKGAGGKLTEFHFDKSHNVIYNWQGAHFQYNPDEMFKVDWLAKHTSDLKGVFIDSFGHASHTIGQGLPLADKSVLFGSFLYLLGSPLKAVRDYKRFAGRRRSLPKESAAARPVGGRLTKEEFFNDAPDNDFRFSRKTALIILSRIKKFADLNAETEAEREEIFKNKAQEILAKDIVVHKVGDKMRSDMDGEMALALLRKAVGGRINFKYIETGKKEEGAIHVDVGEENPLIFAGESVFLDHHGAESGDDLSATEIVYTVLINLGLAKKSEKMDKLVAFITHLDNMSGPFKDREAFLRSHRSILGLYRYSVGKPQQIIDFFMKDPNPDPTRELSEEELKKYGFIRQGRDGKTINFSEMQKGNNEKSVAALRDLEKKKKIISTSYGRILVDEGGSVSKEVFAVSGYDIHLRYNGDGFFIGNMPASVNLREGKRIRNMWLYKGKPTLTLNEIIQALSA